MEKNIQILLGLVCLKGRSKWRYKIRLRVYEKSYVPIKYIICLGTSNNSSFTGFNSDRVKYNTLTLYFILKQPFHGAA